MDAVKVIDRNGGVVGEVAVSERLVRLRTNPQLIHDVVTSYRRNSRRGTASTLTKGEVKGSGIKPWRQKGTGRARAGYRSSPVWRGGGVVFGPKPKDFSRTIPQALRRRACASAFADKLRGGQVVVVEAVEAPGGKTREVARWLSKIGAGRKPLIIIGERNAEVERAARNIAGAAVVNRENLNAWLLMAHGTVVLAKSDFEALQEYWG